MVCAKKAQEDFIKEERANIMELADTYKWMRAELTEAQKKNDANELYITSLGKKLGKIKAAMVKRC